MADVRAAPNPAPSPEPEPAPGPAPAPAPTPPPPSAGSLLRGAARTTRGRLILLATLLLVSTATGLAAPALLATAVDAVLRGSGAAGPAVAWAAVVTLGAVCESVMAPLGTACAAYGARWLRMRTVGHLVGLGTRPPLPAGEAVTRVVQAASQAGALPAAFAQWAVTVAGSLAALCWLWILDWPSGLAFTLATPATVLVARRFVGQVTEAHADYLAAQGAVATRLLTALAGARTIRASDTLNAETARVLAPLPEVSAAGWRMWRLQRGTIWQFGLLMSLTEALVLGVAGFGVSDGRLTAGQLVAVAGYLQLSFQAVEQIDGILGLAQSRAAAARTAAALAYPPLRYGAGGAPRGPGAVSLRRVTVRRDDAVLLDGVDLDLPAGASIALVGRTAAGKSLLAGLPGRLIDPDEGEVLLDGVPVRRFSSAELRRAVTYAFEQPVLVGGTLHDVIAYGRPGLPRAEVERAARAARADGFVRRLPDGYDTALAATPLSGGERQRLGLARTLARQAGVYVLDDATSGLDTVTEAEVGAAVTTTLAGRTRLVVAHRVTTAARCDVVLWLEAGRVRALAPHSALWPDPAYRAVFAAVEGAAS
ncbi:ABC transporter ATP-binding protein/permease [Streptomyces sp. NBC_01476]|uniref:ABC transporter ATP-binding protein n=1 Tax=Streptomyces sp. NBC_01476 TaxID=2903881 RepID=UPI002E2EF689|nr:ABC transporter ATP-binding protein [Streptomyces sp. NBC_01476]